MSHRIRIHVRRHVDDDMWVATCEGHGFTRWGRNQPEAYGHALVHHVQMHKNFLPAAPSVSAGRN